MDIIKEAKIYIYKTFLSGFEAEWRGHVKLAKFLLETAEEDDLGISHIKRCRGHLAMVLKEYESRYGEYR